MSNPAAAKPRAATKTKRPVGAPPKFTTAEVAAALKATAGIYSLAGVRLGCSGNTVRNYVRREPELRDALDEVLESTLDLAEGQLLKAIRTGNMTAIIFYLKTKGRHRGYVQRVESDDVSKLSDAEILALISSGT